MERKSFEEPGVLFRIYFVPFFCLFDGVCMLAKDGVHVGSVLVILYSNRFNEYHEVYAVNFSHQQDI